MNNFDDLLYNAPAGEPGGEQLSKGEYAVKMKSERDAVFQLSDQAAEDVSVDSDVFQQYLDVQSTFDRYSAVNVLLIMSQMPEASRIGDFNHWKEKGGYIKKGETGIVILEPHSYTKEDGSPGTGYNLKNVFDISQVDTRKMRTPAPVPTYSDRQLLQALISKAPVNVYGIDEISNGSGAIIDPERGILVRRHMSFPDTFRSVAKELCYVDLTSSYNTQVDPNFSAYSAAYILCKKYGVDTKDFDFSDMPAVLGDMDAQEIKGELSQIRNAAESISGRMAKHLDAVNKAAKSQEAR